METTWIYREVRGLEKKELPQAWWVQPSLFEVAGLEPAVPWSSRGHGASVLKGPNFLKNEVFLCKKLVFGESENLEQRKNWHPNGLKRMMSFKKETSTPHLFHRTENSFPLNSQALEAVL